MLGRSTNLYIPQTLSRTTYRKISSACPHLINNASISSQLCLPSSPSLGPVDPGSVRKVVKEVTQDEKDRQERFKNRPSLDECLSLHDFEVNISAHIFPFIMPHITTDLSSLSLTHSRSRKMSCP